MVEQKIANYSREDKIIGFTYGFLIFLSCQPYFMWGAGTLIAKLSLVAAVIPFFYPRKLKESDLLIIPLFAFYFIYLYYRFGVLGIINNSIFYSILFVREDKLLLFFDWFKRILVFTLVISLSVYIIAVLFSVPLHYNTIAPLNDIKSWDYRQYPFLVVENTIGFEYRFCGMFDEPGVIGSIVTVLLFADNYNLRTKQNKILFIAGIFSFSFYFFISSIFYFLYLSNNKVRLLIISLFFLVFLLTRNNDIVYYVVWDRFSIEDGKLKGDNRSTEDLDAIYQQFINTDDVYWGKGSEYASRHELDDSCTYKLIVLNYGMVFFVIVCLAFLLYAYFTIKKFKYVIIYCFLFLGMIYQRPGLIYDISLFFMLISSIYAININSNSSTIQTVLPDMEN
jgi:hypothetical protein